MSFLKGLLNIVEAVDSASNDEFEVTREGRRFKILVEGRFHRPTEPWVYDVTATDIITGTSEKVKHFDRKEDGVNEAVNAVMSTLRLNGVAGCVIADRGQQTSTYALASHNPRRSEHINQALMEMLAKKGFVYDRNPPAPSGPEQRSPPPAYQQVFKSTSPQQPTSETARPVQNLVSPQSSQKFPFPEGSEALVQYGKETIEPDVDGLYTSLTISPAHPDPTQLDPSSTYVTWESPSKGFVYILNNSQFPNLPDRSKLRRGSEVDLKNVIHVFSQLGYEPLVHSNLTRQEILRTLDQTVSRINEEGAKHSSFCLFFMSHGNKEGVSGTDARLDDHRIVTRDEIKARLTGRRCKALLGKLKLIFIQACRGNMFTRNADELDAITASMTPVQDEQATFEVDYIPSQSKDQPPKVDISSKVTETPSFLIELDFIESHESTNDFDVDGGGELPNNSDIYVANATSNGYYSIRMQRDGSWFIQAISEIFLAYAHKDELNELMRKVTCLVTESYRANRSDEVTKRKFEVRQTPAYESQGMRRKFYFLPKYP